MMTLTFWGDPAFQNVYLLLVGRLILGRAVVQEIHDVLVLVQLINGFLRADLARVEVVLTLELGEHGDLHRVGKRELGCEHQHHGRDQEQR